MKQSPTHLLQLLLLSVAVTLGVMVWKQSSCHVKKKPPSVAALAHAQQQQKQSTTTASPDLALPLQVQHGIPLEPSALNAPSAEELREFPGAVVLEASEIEGPEPGQKKRLRILNTHFKYPNIRTEEVIDAKNNFVVMRQEMAADHFLVTLAPGENPQAFFKSMGDQVTSMARVTEDALLYRVNLTQRASLKALPAAIAASTRATSGIGEPDVIVHSCSEPPNDPRLYYQWGLYHDNGGIDAYHAWHVRTDASTVIVAIIDSGVCYTHNDLAANMWNNPAPSDGDLHGCNSYANNGDPMDAFGHGTMCAGIIGAVGNNGIGICGIAWNVQLMACRFMDDNSNAVISDAIICIDYALHHGAQILNCSWGQYATFTNQGNFSFPNAIYAAFQRARAAGVIVAAAAGNDAMSNDLSYRLYPASFKLDNIVSVAATNSHDELATFSNYGESSVHLVSN